MPYISKAARERARWITVREALSIIETADSCETKEAWRQLRDAIADGAVAAKWDDASIHGSGQLGRLHFKFAKLNKGGTKVRVPDRRSQRRAITACLWFLESHCVGLGRLMQKAFLVHLPKNGDRVEVLQDLQYGKSSTK